MQKVFKSVDYLDKRCYEKFLLSEDILMENAANSIASFIKSKFKSKSKILIVCGGGNNGADGVALARILYKDYKIKLYLLSPNSKGKMFQLQLNRFLAVGGKIIQNIKKSGYDVVVDAIFGSGLNRELDSNTIDIIDRLNSIKAFKIACDIPTGILSSGTISREVFKANRTITMGSINAQLLNDNSKDFVGKIDVANLGVSRDIYEDNTNLFLLDKKDMNLPFRDKKSSHKGDFGHSYIISGDKKGASTLCALACEKFGSGLTTIYSKEYLSNLPFTIMQTNKISNNISAVAIGMGLGENQEIDTFLSLNIPKVIDADLFYSTKIVDILKDKRVVITPHPKEFVSLMKISLNIDISIKELQSNRLKYCEIFSKEFPNIVLILKGSNTIIAYQNRFYFNTFGDATLSKGGSGDILAGMITALLAQGYSRLYASITSVIAHSLLSKKIKRNNFSSTAIKLIEAIEKL
jgi:hydroxyethylthiazole kinase-like uncharacterized protein yjeF